MEEFKLPQKKRQLENFKAPSEEEFENVPSSFMDEGEASLSRQREEAFHNLGTGHEGDHLFYHFIEPNGIQEIFGVLYGHDVRIQIGEARNNNIFSGKLDGVDLNSDQAKAVWEKYKDKYRTGIKSAPIEEGHIKDVKMQRQKENAKYALDEVLGKHLRKES